MEFVHLKNVKNQILYRVTLVNNVAQPDSRKTKRAKQTLQKKIEQRVVSSGNHRSGWWRRMQGATAIATSPTTIVNRLRQAAANGGVALPMMIDALCGGTTSKMINETLDVALTTVSRGDP